MKSLDISLVRHDFIGASNGCLLTHAYDNRGVIQSYLKKQVYDVRVTLRYPDNPERDTLYFDEANFSDPRFIHAIDSYVLADCQTIINQAEERDIVAEVKAQFKGVEDLISMGYLPLGNTFYNAGRSQKTRPANIIFDPVSSFGALFSIADYRTGGP